MLKKYAKRFSRSVMGGLGPTPAKAHTEECKIGSRSILISRQKSSLDNNDPLAEIYRWPPHSRKVIDDEDEEEEAQDEKTRSPPVPKRRSDRVCRTHLSSCSSNATTATTSTGEEGFGSESSLEELRSNPKIHVQEADEQRTTERNKKKTSKGRIAGGELLAINSSSTYTLSSLSSTGSESVWDVVSQLRSTLFYYALVFRF